MYKTRTQKNIRVSIVIHQDFFGLSLPSVPLKVLNTGTIEVVTSWKYLSIKVTPDLHGAYCENGENLSLLILKDINNI